MSHAKINLRWCENIHVKNKKLKVLRDTKFNTFMSLEREDFLRHKKHKPLRNKFIKLWLKLK